MTGDSTPETRRRDEPVGVPRRLIASFREQDIGGLAAEMAYRFLFAVFPFGLFVAALGGVVASLLQVENPAGKVIAGLGDNLPPEIAEAVQPELERLLTSASGGLLSLGAIAALWSATGGTNALIKGMHRAYDVPEQRPFLLRYGVAVALTLLAAVGVIGSFVTIVGGALLTEEIAQQLGLGAQAVAMLQLLRWPAIFVVLTLAVAVLYRYAPSVVVPWRWIVAGAAAFTLGWLVATALLGWYAANLANFGATYGSLGAVILLMLWFYVTAALLLLGAALTAALARERTPEEIRPRGEEALVAETVDRATERAAEVARRSAEDVRG